MKNKFHIILPLAVGLVVLATAVYLHNNAAAPKPSDIEPIKATGNVDDAVNALNQGAAVEDSIMSESDSDLDLAKTDANDAQKVIGAYDVNSF